MDTNLNLLVPHIRHFCEAGYIRKAERVALYNMADLYAVPHAEVDALVEQEINRVKEQMISELFRYSGQPEAALKPEFKLYPESKRSFPEVLDVGTLQLELNPEIVVPACISVAGLAGVTYVGKDLKSSCDFVQNIAIRLLLSIPRGLAKVTLIDPEYMGMSFIELSGLDRGGILDVISDEKEVFPFLQRCNQFSSSFSFDQLGIRFSDIAAYNKLNRAAAYPYHIVLIAGNEACFNEQSMAALDRLFRLAARTGYFFLFALTPDLLTESTKRLLGDNTCYIDDSGSRATIATKDNPYDLYNRACKFVPEIQVAFDDTVIAEINHEFDRDKYSAVVQPVSSDTPTSIQTLNLFWEEKGFNTALPAADKANVVFFYDKKEKASAVWKTMLSSLDGSLTPDEVKVYLFNTNCLSDDRYLPILANRIHSDKFVYLNGLIRHVSGIISARNDEFSKVGVLNYTEYREKTNQAIPRILVVVDDIGKVCSDYDLETEEIIRLLNESLEKSARFGIHFVLGGEYSSDCLKIDFSNIRYRLYSGLSSQQMMELGLSLPDTVIADIPQGFRLAICDVDEDSSTVLELKQPSTSEIGTKTRQDVIIGSPIDFIDLPGDDYPDNYKAFSIDNVALDGYVNACPVGIPRFYSDRFYSLPLDGRMILVSGNDSVGERSLLHSLETVSRKRSLSFQVYDGSARNAVGIPGLRSEVLHELKQVKFVNGGVLCIRKIEVAPAEISEWTSLLDEADRFNMTVVLFVSPGMFAQDEWEGVFAKFDAKLALQEAPEDFVSPVHFIVNEKLELPSAPLQALYESTQSVSGMGVDMFWLFNF